MKRLFVLAIALVVISAPAFAANLLVNGDFNQVTGSGTSAQPDGWTYGKASWGSSNAPHYALTGTDTTKPSSFPSGSTWPGFSAYEGYSAYFYNGSETYSAWYYQAIDVQAGATYKISGMWQTWAHATANADQAAWFEVMFFNDDGRTANEQIDSPKPGATVAKREIKLPDATSWTLWENWGSIENHLTSANANYVTATGSKMYVAVKAGINFGSEKRIRAGFDNLAVEAVPEPASLLALGSGLIGLVGMIRRKK